jgi:hypothetical protein
MQEKILYEYAVIRVVPRVEREEFINIGVILFSKKAKFIKMKYVLDESRLKMFSPELDIDLLKDTLISFEKVCNGDSAAGTIAQFDIPERFRWLTAVRSSCIQTSRPHPGYANNLKNKLENLFQELVI